MGKASIIIYITLAILLLLLISYSPKTTKSSSHRRHRRLKLRSNFSFSPGTDKHHDPVAFDPLVADIERKREDKQWEQNTYKDFAHLNLTSSTEPEWEDFMNAEDYVNDEYKFNITHRLLLLFPKIDIDPSDGLLTDHELTDWILKNSEREVMHRSQREMELHDKNRDGFVSFAEYEPPSWVRNSDNISFGYEMGWWKEEHFNASDADGDSLLNLTEFNDFLHPADSKNLKLLHWLCQEEIRERDTDKDGKINFKEFFHGLFDFVRDYDKEDHDSSHESNDSRESLARKLLAELDKDSDGFLSDVELLPVVGKLHPSERYYAKQQADYIMSQADKDKDGHLTLMEMIDSPYVFYSAVFSEEDEDEDDYHDEFR